MSDMPNTTAPSADSTASEPSKPIDYQSFTRTVITPPGSTVGPAPNEREIPRKPVAPRAPRAPTAAERLARLDSREKALQHRAALLSVAEESLLPPQERERRVVERHHREAIDHVQQNAGDYPLTALFHSESQVPQLIYAWWNRTGQLLSHKQAAQEVERYLTGLYEQADATKKGARSRSGPPRSSSPPRSASPTAAPADDRRPFSSEERLRRAAAAMDAVLARRR